MDDIFSDIDNINVSNPHALSEPEDCKLYLKKDNICNLSVISMNIRSINKNIMEFEVYLDRFDHQFDVVVLTECWLQVVNFPPNLTNYITHYTKLTTNQNDGVVVYVRDTLQNVYVLEPRLKDASCLVLKQGHNFSLIALYRSPSYNPTNFLDSLHNLLLDMKDTPNIAIIGDININIIESVLDKHASEYLTLLAAHGLLPGHTYPTRGTNCIDHCMIKAKTSPVVIQLPATITDHCPIIAQFYSQDRIKNITDKSYKQCDYQGVCRDLLNIDWSKHLDMTDVNGATDSFLKILSSIIEKYTVVKNIPRSRRNKKPWITPGLIRCMRKRDKLHLKSRKEPNNNEVKDIYTKYRNTCNNLLKRLKRIYERSEFKKCSKDYKKTWQNIKRVCNFANKRNQAEELLKLEPDNLKSLNKVNNYFINVGSNLANEILCNSNTSETSLAAGLGIRNHQCESLCLLPTDEMEVYSIIQSLKIDSAPGWDGITTRLIKKTLPYVLKPITLICQASLDSGVVPKALKKSIISPIHKGGDGGNVSNYRPISLLPTLSKILEKIVNKRLRQYLESKSLLSNNQFGFRAQISTEHAVKAMTEQIILQLDKSRKTIGVFLDLAKAFDTVSIPILLAKLEAIGIRGIPLQWFKSYLTERSQMVKINESTSEEAKISFGVPQGSILGPTLFLIYINDLCEMQLERGLVFTYADDTVLLFEGKSWSEVQSLANKGINKVVNWLRNNLLTINVSKTNYMTFALNKSSQPKSPLSLQIHDANCACSASCSCSALSPTEHMKYLGIIIDKHLRWTEHIKKLEGRTRKLIYTFKKLRHILPEDTFRTVYYALGQSIITYCISIWGAAATTNILPLERAQRALLKVMFFKPRRYSTEALYKEAKVLTVRQLFIKATIHGQHAKVDKELLDRQTHKRRKDIIFTIPTYRTMYARKSFIAHGPILYNRINKVKNFMHLNRNACTRYITEYLLQQNYENTEKLLRTLD